MKVGALLFVLALAPAALADTPPSTWDVVKDPNVGKAYDVHVAVQGWFAGADEARLEARLRSKLRGSVSPSFQTIEGPFYEHARTLLEEAGAKDSPDVRLRFDYGLCLERLSRHVEAAAVLKDALAIAPWHPMATEGMHPGWLNYSFANAYLENPEEERRGYEHYLERATELPDRMVPMLNLAEAEMHLGNLAESVRWYEATKQLAASLPNDISMETGILATWGLAVALDRGGDFGGAARAAESAVSMDPPPDSTHDPFFSVARLPASYAVSPSISIRKTIILDENTVFFVPKYERKWYLALGETALAKGTADPVVALFHWRNVEKFWTDYVTDARKHTGGDRFLATAEKRLDAATKQRHDLEKRVGPGRSAPTLRGREIFIE